MRTFSLYDVFIRNANVAGNSIAIIDGDCTLTFQELHAEVGKVADYLQRQGIEKGDRVALLSMNRCEFFTLLGAIGKLGAILLPLNWRLAESELQYIIDDCTPKLLFSDSSHMENAKVLSQKCQLQLIELKAIRNLEEAPSHVIAHPAEPLKPETPLCIIYTAAVEGYPRGAVLSHNNVISANSQVINSMGLDASDCNLNMLPLFHITGLNLALSVMQVGGSNVVMEKFDDARALELTSTYGVTLWGSFPPMLSRMIEQVRVKEVTLNTLKYIVGLDGEETISQIEKLTGATFWILYGQSETSGFVTFGPALDRAGSAGVQGALTTYSLVDDNDQEVAIGETGEIVVKGPLVFQGYWQLDDVNKRTFRNGWHHTGDLGVRDSEGYLFFKGRKPEKELIKPGGENVYPAEVEAVILEHPRVEKVCVIGVPDADFGEGIKAVCVLEGSSSFEKEDLINFVADRIARYKKPKYIEFVQELPMKGGEVDRQKVKELWGE